MGCSLGDFGALYLLSGSGLSMGATMGIAMASGVATSMALETARLRYGKDRFSWPIAFQTATKMSLISMLVMESAENAVDYFMLSSMNPTATAVCFDPSQPYFFPALAVSLAAGFLAPWPYNYYAIKKHGKSCH